jgi:short subunit dehydrogenase-like uncharacterized protein
MGNRILIYGATGYVGRLLAKRAANEGLPVVLAARDERKLAELGEELDLPYLAFSLESPAARAQRLKSGGRKRQRKADDYPENQAVNQALRGVGVVLNAAGPFANTALPLARGCYRTGTHYVDIGGEHEVFGQLKELRDDVQAKLKSGEQAPEIALVPGVGLTVLASDWLLYLALTTAFEEGLDLPHTVRVALSRVPSISRGSAKTMLDSVRSGVLIRRAGHPAVVPVGSLRRSFAFGVELDGHFACDDPRICTAMTLADSQTVGSTAERVYGDLPDNNVTNIETYVEASSLEQLTYDVAGEFALALRSWPLKTSMDYLLGFWPEGPRDEERDATRQQVVVEVEDRYARSVRARLSTPNSYDFTVTAALATARLLLGPRKGLNGFLSPSEVFTSNDADEDTQLESWRKQAFAGCQARLATRGLRKNVTKKWPEP